MPEGTHSQSIYSCLVSGSFHFVLPILFSFPSRYYCAIGLEECLGLEVDTPAFPLPIKGTVLWRPAIRLRHFAYETITLYGRAFQPTSARVARLCTGPNPTSHHTRRMAVRFVLRGFQSPLLTASRLLSLPALTKMFQFCAFALATRLPRSRVEGCPIRPSVVLRLHAPRHSLSQLATTFIASQAKPSSRQHGS